jgi:hypothetical protein
MKGLSRRVTLLGGQTFGVFTYVPGIVIDVVACVWFMMLVFMLFSTAFWALGPNKGVLGHYRHHPTPADMVHNVEMHVRFQIENIIRPAFGWWCLLKMPFGGGACRMDDIDEHVHYYMQEYIPHLPLFRNLDHTCITTVSLHNDDKERVQDYVRCITERFPPITCNFSYSVDPCRYANGSVATSFMDAAPKE